MYVRIVSGAMQLLETLPFDFCSGEFSCVSISIVKLQPSCSLNGLIYGTEEYYCGNRV